jgi:hypothetical protein
MKSERPSSRKPSAGRSASGSHAGHLPIEWMDPMSWRLPSGKALAEFALQAGFLAPLILSGPKPSRKERAQRSAGVHTRTAEIGTRGEFSEIGFGESGPATKDFSEAGFKDAAPKDSRFDDAGFRETP